MAKVRTVSASEVGSQARAAAAGPSAEVMSGALKTVTATDAMGRQIAVRKLSAVEKMRLMRTLGEHTSNQVYYSHAVIAACVRAVDDTQYPSLPASIAQIEAKVALLDEHGMDAAAKALQELFPELADPAEVATAAKN